jgi:FMN-dependent NADH-azoreductase
VVSERPSQSTLPERVLLVTGSPRGAESISTELAEAFLSELRAGRPGVVIDRLDPFTELEPFAGLAAEAKMAILGRQPLEADAEKTWTRILDVGARVTAADVLVFAVPMWNGGIPWSLKLFIDTVTQPGLVFGFHPTTGYHGLLGGRRAVAIYTSRVFAPGVEPAFGVDHQSTYLSWWLGYAGIEDVYELRLQPTFDTPDLPQRRTAALEQARVLARRLATQERAEART